MTKEKTMCSETFRRETAALRASRRITINTDEHGNAIGESHHRAKLSDADVDFIRDVYEEGQVSCSVLASVFKVSKSSIWDIVTFRRRNAIPMSYRIVQVDSARPATQDRLAQLYLEAQTVDEAFDE
jgi:hypothetical protein